MGELVSLKVTKANELIEAGYKLTLNEQRVVLAAIAQVDSRKPMPKGKITIHAAHFAETFGVEPKHAYEALEDAANRLFERDIQTYDQKNRIRERFRWVYYVKYHEGKGCVTLGFSPEITPYLTLLHKRFTSYELRQISRLGSPYAIRLYELLKQFAKTGERVIALDQFKERLELTDKYSRFSNLKARVIQPAIDEINSSTNLEVRWNTIRKGRTAVTLRFVFHEARQTQLPL